MARSIDGSIVYSNADELAAKYEAQAKLNPARMRKLARDTGDFIVGAARARLVGHSRTTTLSRNIKRTGVQRTSEDTWSVNVGVFGSSSRYSRFVEYGTGMFIDPRIGTPHLIYPKTASVMSWTERGKFATPYSGTGIFNVKVRGGKSPQYKIFAKYTHGQEGVHYMEEAFKTADHLFVPVRLAEIAAEIIH